MLSPMAAVPAPFLLKALEGAEAHPAEAEPQTAGMTTAILLSYTESRGGRAAVEQVLELSGLLGREDELRDESTWWTFIQKRALMEAVAHVLDDPQATRRAGAHALEAGVGTTLKAALRAFGSPELVYANVARGNDKLSRHSRMDARRVSKCQATLSYRHVVDVRYSRVDCLYNQGVLAVVPELFGLPPARVSQTQCALDGAEACVYEIRWEPRSRLARWSPMATAAGVVAGAAGAALAYLPVTAPGAAVAVAGGAAWAGSSAITARRRRTDLEAELETRVRSAESLRTSLRQLAGELDPESLATQIIDGGRRAMGADAAALLQEQSGRLMVQRASGLGARAQRALESWIASIPAGATGIQVIDDAATVPTLEPLVEGPPPMTSLCCAPLPAAAGPAATLMVLSRTSAKFLPQDVDWFEAYATQAGVALSNARLYSQQQEMARRDELTGLGNRRAFEEALDAEAVRYTRAQREFSVAVLDLDRFKVVNDIDGHAAGDELLCKVARALATSGRASDSVFRLGGDEFAVVMPDTSTADAAGALTRTASWAAACDRRVGASVGIATCPTDGLIKDDLLRVADARLSEAKPPRRRA